MAGRRPRAPDRALGGGEVEVLPGDDRRAPRAAAEEAADRADHRRGGETLDQGGGGQVALVAQTVAAVAVGAHLLDAADHAAGGIPDAAADQELEVDVARHQAPGIFPTSRSRRIRSAASRFERRASRSRATSRSTLTTFVQG